MGCSNSSSNFDIKNINQREIPYFKAYNSFITISNILENNKRVLLELFLISGKSIKNYINGIRNSISLKYLYKENKEKIIMDLNDLKEFFEKYELENIEFYSKYNNCLKIAKEDNKEDNEFIIVDSIFIENMQKENKNYENQKILVDIDRNEDKNEMKIKFYDSQEYIKFQKKEFGYYKFITEMENNNINSNDRINPYINLIYDSNNSVQNPINEVNINIKKSVESIYNY